MRKLTTRTSAAVAGGVVALAAAGVAYAAWSSSGSGVGAAASTTSTNSVISAGTLSPLDDLYPGAVAATTVVITNPNPYPVEVTSIGAGSSRTVGSCAADTVRTDALGDGTLALTRSDAASTVIPAGLTGSYSLVLRMSNTAAEACKSQAFVIGDRTTPANNMTATLRSAASTAGNGF